MNNLSATVWIELRKATRSRAPLLTAVGFLIMPLAGAFFMIIYKDPEFARQAGLISAKAQLVAGSADWPTYLSLLSQAVAVGGIVLFSLIGSWVFGREFVDGTMKDLLAVPVSRSSIVLAKFVIVAVWSGGLALMIYLAALGMGALIVLPQVPIGVFLQGGATLAITAGLVIALVTPIALFASIGRGYLLPLGVAFLAIVLAQIIAAIGWGSYFPWSVPALYAGIAGGQATLDPASFWIVILTGLAGMLGTDLWWKYADQNR
jgi:ABC-2 type transport system permease protein